MIEVIFKARNIKQLKEILEWIKKEEIERNHPNIEIKIGVK